MGINTHTLTLNKNTILIIKSIIIINTNTLTPFPCIPIFNNFKKSLTIKSIIVINTHTLTLHKNPVFRIFNHKKYYGNKYVYINHKKHHSNKYTYINTK